jgi:hypothetical protein
VVLPQTYESQLAMNTSREEYMNELEAITEATNILCKSLPSSKSPCSFPFSPRDMSISEGFGSIGFYLAFHGFGSPGHAWMVDTHARSMVANIYASLYPAALKPQKQFRRALLIPSEPKRTKVGFISSFFHEHSVGKLTLGISQSLDRSRFEVVLIALNDGPVDDVATRIRQNVDSVYDLNTSSFGEMRNVLAVVKVCISFFGLHAPPFGCMLPPPRTKLRNDPRLAGSNPDVFLAICRIVMLMTSLHACSK